MIISYFKFFIISSPKLCNLLMFSSLAALLVIYLFLTVKALNNIFLKLKDRSELSYRCIHNLDLNYSYELPLDYKIYSLPITIFKISCYIFFCIIFFIILRYFRLGLEINLPSYWSKFITLPYIIIFIIGIIYLLFFYLVLLFWSIIYFKFYKELKKLYIYLYQFGGVLDPSSYYYLVLNNSTKYCEPEPNINRLFLDYLHYFVFEGLSWFLLKLIDKPVMKAMEPFSFALANQQVPVIFIPLYYFLNYSTYSENINILYIKYLLDQLRYLLKPIVKLFPYLVIIIDLLYEIFFSDAILKNIFYILLFVFIYNMFINLAIFYDHQISPYNLIICIYYYEKDIFSKADEKTLGKIKTRLMIMNIESVQNMLTYMDRGLNGGYVITDLEKWLKLKKESFFNLNFVKQLCRTYKNILAYLNRI